MLSKPILKWVGGKTQIINKVINKFPCSIKNYYELFLGGGSVLIKLLEEVKCGKIVIEESINVYDINKSLINFYKNVRDNPIELYDTLNKMIKIFNECSIETIELNRDPVSMEEACKCKENYYYWIRRLYNENINKGSILSSAMFLFINKTGFRGLYRENKKKEINVPYGHYKSPKIVNKEHIIYISELIRDVKFECMSYEDSYKEIKESSFIYLDPPYVPINEKSFVNYTSEYTFTMDKHKLLFDTIKECKYKFILHNSYTEYVLDNFNKDEYNIEKVECKRAINPNNPESTEYEVIISN